MADDIQISNRLMDGFMGITKTLIFLQLSILVLSVYLVQRALVAEPLEMMKQLEVSGIEFYYNTLSILWPIVLGGFALAFTTLVVRQKAMWCLLCEKVDQKPEHLLSTDPFYVFHSVQPSRLLRGSWLAVSWLPFIAILLHGLLPLGSLIGIIVGGNVFAELPFVVLIGSRGIACLVGIALVSSYPSAVRRLRRILDAPTA